MSIIKKEGRRATVLADRIRRYRRNHGLTQTDLAQRLNVAQNTVACYESGKRRPGLKSLFALAQMMGCTVDELMKEGFADEHRE